MNKVNNKFCNVNNFDYDENKKILTVKYKLNIEKTYKNFPKKSYEKLLEENAKNKTIGIILKQEIKSCS